MARYQITLAYDGTHFSGSQRQASSRTVQSELEKALRGLGWTHGSVILAGRTDTGVHASGQCAAFDLDWKHAPEKLIDALNSRLPDDLSAHSLRAADDHFHPRFDATSRRYRYRIFRSSVRDPLRERYEWRINLPVDPNLLHEVSRVFIGKHDFASFGTAPRAGSSTIRNVMKSIWNVKDDQWAYEVQADAFLYRMVRRLVFVQMMVGQGRLKVDAVTHALRSGTPLPAGLAPAHGLTLVEVTYPPFETNLDQSSK
jgi:tRNA pseudouridine38-40 synthase